MIHITKKMPRRKGRYALSLCLLLSGGVVLAQINGSPAPVSPTEKPKAPGSTTGFESPEGAPNGNMLPGSQMGNQMKMPHRDFGSLHKIQMINSAEIKLGQVAKQKSQSSQIKQYGDMLVREHTQSKNDFAKLDFGTLSRSGIGPDASQFQADLDKAQLRLETVKPDQFDVIFIDEMISGHQKAIDLAGQIKAEGHSQQIRDFATEFNVMVSRHLDEANALQRGAVAH